MNVRALSIGLGLTLAAAGCGNAKREQARLDSIRQDSIASHVRDSVAQAMAQRVADSIAAVAAPKGTAPTKTSPKSGTKSGAIIGRDSVIMNPKPIGLPIVADTAKRRPPF